MEFMTETEDYNVSEFYEKFETVLPVVAKVKHGFYGNINENTFDKDEVIFIVAVSKQDRVVTKLLGGNRFRLLSIPVTIQQQFCVVEADTRKRERFLNEILKTRKLPVTVQFPPNRCITVGTKSINTNHIPAMELKETFKEMYLLGNMITDGEFDDGVVHVPLYLSQLRLSKVTGIKGKSTASWNIYFYQLVRRSSQVEYDLQFGNQNIAEYDESVLQSALSYSYAEPVTYESLLDLMKGQENTYATLAENKPQDRRPKTFEEFSVNDLVEQLKVLGMGKFAESFAVHKIDGKLLVKLDDKLLIEELGMTRREITRLRNVSPKEEIGQGHRADNSEKIHKDDFRRMSHIATPDRQEDNNNRRSRKGSATEVRNSTDNNRQAQAMMTSTVTSRTSHSQQTAPEQPPRSHLLIPKPRKSEPSDSKKSPNTVPEALAQKSKVLKRVVSPPVILPKQDTSSHCTPPNVKLKGPEMKPGARDGRSDANSLSLKKLSSNASLTEQGPACDSNISPRESYVSGYNTPRDTHNPPHDTHNTPRDKSRSCVIIDIAALSVEEVCIYLKQMDLHKYITVFKSELIDGVILSQLDEDILTKELSMTRLEANRLRKFVKDGNLPKLHSKLEHFV